MPEKQFVWDIWVRLGHWALAVGVGLQFLTGGELAWQTTHASLGFLILGWVLFRVLWGLFGPPSARFATFVPRTVEGLRTSLAALKGGTPERPASHTQLGGLGVIVLLTILGLVALTGAASSDDIFFEGPLARHLSSDLVSLATSAHHWLTTLLLVLIGLHLAAVAWHQWRLREPLIQGMWHGRKPVDSADPVAAPTGPRLWIRGFALLLCCLLGTWLALAA